MVFRSDRQWSETKKITTELLTILCFLSFVWITIITRPTSNMQNLQPPSKFSFKPEEWTHWLKQFRRYRSASKLATEPGETQRDSLLYIMGEESEKIFETLKFGTRRVGEGDDAIEEEEEDTDFETLVSKFNDYFIVKRNIIHERTKFQERKQHDSETVEEYYRALRALVVHCEYTDTEDQERDRFIVGLRDPKLKERLQLIHDLSLSKAVEISRQHEQIKEQMKQQGTNAALTDETRSTGRSKFRMTQHASGAATARNRNRSMHTSVRRNIQHDRSENFRGGVRGRGQSYSSRRPASERQCGKCGREHPQGQCPAKGQQCRRCKKRGHFQRMCYSVRELQQTQIEEEEEEFFLESVITDCTKPWTATLRIKNVDVLFKIDTGADVTIINEKTYERFKNRPQLTGTRIKLTSREVGSL